MINLKNFTFSDGDFFAGRLYEKACLTNIRFDHMSLTDITFRNCVFTSCAFNHVTFSNCRFIECVYDKCVFESCSFGAIANNSINTERNKYISILIHNCCLNNIHLFGDILGKVYLHRNVICMVKAKNVKVKKKTLIRLKQSIGLSNRFLSIDTRLIELLGKGDVQ